MTLNSITYLLQMTKKQQKWIDPMTEAIEHYGFFLIQVFVIHITGLTAEDGKQGLNSYTTCDSFRTGINLTTYVLGEYLSCSNVIYWENLGQEKSCSTNFTSRVSSLSN